MAAQNYDRPQIFWSTVAAAFIQTSLLDAKSKAALDKAGKEKLEEIFDLEDTKLGAVFIALAQKPNKKLPIIQLFVHYSLLELCLKFCHQSASLRGFEEVLDYTLETLAEYSVPILQEFINMIQGVASSYQFAESQNLSNWVYLIKILRKLIIAFDNNNNGVGDIKEGCVKCAELLNDSILKLSFFTDNDFSAALQELALLLREFQTSQIAQRFQLSGTIINNFYMLIMGIEKRTAHENLKDNSELVLMIYNITISFVLSAPNADDISIAFKLLQKVLYLLKLEALEANQVKEVLGKLEEIKKKLIFEKDESFCLTYLETLRKFLLAHIESGPKPIQEEMMMIFYKQLHEIFILSKERKFSTLHETILEYIHNTTRILVDLGVLNKEGENKSNEEIFNIINKFPKEDGAIDIVESSPKLVTSKSEITESTSAGLKSNEGTPRAQSEK